MGDSYKSRLHIRGMAVLAIVCCGHVVAQPGDPLPASSREPESRESVSQESLILESLSQESLSQESLSQESLSQESLSQESLPEEITITGQRSAAELRIRMMETEKAAYEIFNRFNDDKRFTISCSVQARTGSHMRRQVCRPAFELDAERAHALDFKDSITYTNPGSIPGGSVAATHSGLSMEAEINRHQAAYKEKIREVAQEHPEFLRAVMRYVEVQNLLEARLGLTDAAE